MGKIESNITICLENSSDTVSHSPATTMMQPGSKFCPLILVLMLLGGIAHCMVINLRRNGKPVLLVSFDGFRWDYLKRGLTPTFHSISVKGGSTKFIKPPFLTSTLPSHFSLVTGLHEESHGVTGSNMYDPHLNEFFTKNNNEEKWWSQKGQEPIWITNQRQGGSSGVIEFPGMGVAYGSRLPDHQYSRLDTSRSFQDLSDKAVELFANDHKVNFVALRFNEPDKTGHLHGPHSKKMNAAIAHCDKTMKHLIMRMREKNLFGKVNIIITSDHGMAPTSRKRTIFAAKYLDRTAHPYFTSENNPLLGIWPHHAEHIDPLYRALKVAPHISVYKKADIPFRYHYRMNIRIAPIVALADKGWNLVGTKYDSLKLSAKGNHGYNNSLPSMRPFFIAHGPAFKKGAIVPPFHTVDIYPLMCRLLGIKPNPHNGTMDTVGLLLEDLTYLDGMIVGLIFGLMITGISFCAFAFLLSVMWYHHSLDWVKCVVFGKMRNSHNWMNESEVRKPLTSEKPLRRTFIGRTFDRS